MINVVAGRHGENPKFETFSKIQIIDTNRGRVRTELRFFTPTSICIIRLTLETAGKKRGLATSFTLINIPKVILTTK